MKNILILSIGLVFSSIMKSDTPLNIQDIVAHFVTDPNLENASISFEAIDLSTGEVLAQHHAKNSIVPASVSKLFTTAMAIDQLGAEYKPKTKFFIEGTLEEGVLKGNLWVKGGGDVSFSSRYYNEENKEFTDMLDLADTLNDLGIKKIDGNIMCDGSDFGYDGNPDGWIWGDMGNYYGAGPSALSYSDNILKLYYKTGKQATMITRMEPVVEGIKMSNVVVAEGVDGDNTYVYGAPYSLDRFATGRLPRNQNDFIVKASIPDAELNFSVQLMRNMKDVGIEVSGKALGYRTNMDQEKPYKDKEPFYVLEGKSVLSLAWWTNHKSVNLFAETLLQLGDFNKNARSSIRTAPDFMEEWVKTKIDNKGLYLKDGSGLSRSTAMSAHHLCEILKWANAASISKDFRSTLPVAGVSGTVKGLCKNQAASGRFYAKSGTMSRVKSYAGYIDCASGKKIAVALIVNNFNCTSSKLVENMEPIFNALAKM
jgi:serine-type D-Ala-D-Ala carboxypeptidase/endopeptidase (penicillin-binding protein 4)